MNRTVLLVLFAFPIAAAGAISAPNSHATLSPDGKRLLVMLSWDVKYDPAPTATLPDGRVIRLRESFAKSGAYDVATLAPIWQVDWFAFRRDLLWSDDFRHVARLNRNGFRSDWALAFYDNGKIIQTYDCTYLLTSMRQGWCLPYETWDWHTRWYEDFDLSSDGGRVLLSTARRRVYIAEHVIDLGLQEFYTFDIATGAVTERRSAGGWRVWAYGGTALAIVLVSVGAVRVVWRQARASVR